MACSHRLTAGALWHCLVVFRQREAERGAGIGRQLLPFALARKDAQRARRTHGVVMRGGNRAQKTRLLVETAKSHCCGARCSNSRYGTGNKLLACR